MKKSTEKKKKGGFSLISEERLLKLYEAITCFEMLERASAGKKLKQENDAALAAGVLLHLHGHERVLLSMQKRGHRLLKGEQLSSVLHDARHAARAGILALNEHSSASEQLHLASGVALALKNRRKNPATVIFIEGNQTAGKEWESALQFAVQQKLGLVVLCKGAPRISARNKKNALGYDEPGSRSAVKGLPPVLLVDGSDSIAVYRVAQEALTHAREGSRPTVIRALGANEIGEINALEDQEPLIRMENYLKSKGLFTAKLKNQVRKEFTARLKSARKG
jgi:TPP-dependent pyruvate/acetoin dehydrogenase alpha subunit